MSPRPWIAAAVAPGVEPLALSTSSSDASCCACPQPKTQALSATEAMDRLKRCGELTCPHSYGARGEASSDLSATHGRQLYAHASFPEKFVVRGCASTEATILRPRWHADDPRQASSPLASSTPSIKFRFCTAAPDASLPGLSSRATIRICCSYPNTNRSSRFVSLQATGFR